MKSGIIELTSPGDIMAFGAVLREHIEKNKLSVSISGRNYPMVDAWKYAGMNFGVTSIPDEPLPMHTPGQMVRIGYHMAQFKDKQGTWREFEKAGYVGMVDETGTFDAWKKNIRFTRELIMPHYAYSCQATVNRLTDGVKISGGDGFCENLELTKVGFPQYAVRSMAQTRAIGKSLRNLLGYVMNSAGYEATPAEEMEEERAKEAEKNDDRMSMTDEVFKKAVIKLAKKETTIEKIEKSFRLTAEQLKTLKELEK